MNTRHAGVVDLGVGILPSPDGKLVGLEDVRADIVP
jgi:hypothetical protein